MAFDPKRYEEEVLKPLRRPGARPDDLLGLYAVETGMGAGELEERVRRVRSLWNQKAGGVTGLARVCQLLLTADEDRRRDPAVRLTDPQWWRRQARDQERTAASVVDRLAADLQAAYGALGSVTPAQLDGVAGRSGLAAPQVADAVARSGLRTIEAVDLPAADTLDRSTSRTLRDRLPMCGVRSVVELVHADLAGPYRLATGFAVPGRPGLRLDADVLARRLREAEAAADSSSARARKEVLALLAATVRGRSVDLRTIALAHVLDDLRERRDAGLPQVVLVKAAEDLGLVRDDAVVLVASLLSRAAEAAGPRADASRAASPAEVLALVERGGLREAQAAVAALPEGIEGREAATRQVDAVAVRVRQLQDEAGRVAADRREAAAEGLLLEACRLASDDEGLERLLAGLPPPPPGGATARAAGAAVEVAWQPSRSLRGPVGHRVVRAVGRAPLHVEDGETVAGPDAALDAAHTRDLAPPTARPLRYAVFASVDGRTWSRPTATGEVVVLPPVSEVAVDARLDRITLGWACDPAAVEVRVRRTPAATGHGGGAGPALPARRRSFVDPDVVPGERYSYALTAGYRGPAGEELRSQAVVVTAVPRPPPVAVTDLAAGHVEDGGRTLVRLGWSVRPGTEEVRIRRSPTLPPWPVGGTVDLAALDGYGREVTGPGSTVDGRAVLEAEALPGRAVYVPFSVGAGRAVVGEAVPAGLVAPVSELHARRLGDRVTLSWVWPADATLAEVRWRSPDGADPDGTVRVSRSEYAHDGGCPVVVGAAATAFEVRTETVGPAGTAVSAGVTVTVPARPPRLRYTIDRVPGWRGRASPLRRVITVSAEVDCAGVELVVVAGTDRTLPLGPGHGTVVARRSDLALSPDRSEVLEVDVPGTVPRPFWLRCFALRPGGVTVADPPVDAMRVP